jgi:D-aminoacyl-tRNA deacylase
MRVVLQRVKRAEVECIGSVDTKTVGQIAEGFLILLGITHDDTEKDVDWLVEKILKLRLFPGDGGDSGFEKNIVEVGGSILVVSQFTLYGDCKKGTRPSFSSAARPEQAEPLYEYFIQKCLEADVHTESGRFGEHMEVDLVNDGPVTMVIDSKQ